MVFDKPRNLNESSGAQLMHDDTTKFISDED